MKERRCGEVVRAFEEARHPAAEARAAATT